MSSARAYIKYRYVCVPSIYYNMVSYAYFLYTYDLCASIKSNTTACRILVYLYLEFITVVSNELFMKTVQVLNAYLYTAAVNTAI